MPTLKEIFENFLNESKKQNPMNLGDEDKEFFESLRRLNGNNYNSVEEMFERWRKLAGLD